MQFINFCEMTFSIQTKILVIKIHGIVSIDVYQAYQYMLYISFIEGSISYRRVR